MSWRARIWRYFKRLALGVALLLALLVGTLTWLTQSASGRARLLALALGQAKASLPGHIEVRELSRLEPSGIELRGVRVRDPSGAIVAELEQLSVELDPAEIVRGRIVLPEVTLAQGELDLRTLGDAKRGLIAAFVDPAAPKTPPSPGPPPYVSVRRIAVRQLDVRAPPLGPLGQLDVKEIAIDASFELDETPAAVVRQLTARFEREDKPLGKLSELSGALGRGREPSTLALKMQVSGIDVELEAELTLPPERSWQREPLSASLRVQGVSSSRLASLLSQPELEQAFAGEVGLELEATGSVERLLLGADVVSPAGHFSLSARSDELRQAAATLTTRGFRPSLLRPDLPDRRLSLTLAVEADATDAARIPVSLGLSGELDTTALPSVELTGTVTPTSVQSFDLRARDGQSRLRARGTADFNGAAALELEADVAPASFDKWLEFSGQKLDARGQLHAALAVKLDAQQKLEARGDVSVRELAVGDARVERAAVALDVKGPVERLQGKLKLDVENAHAGVDVSAHAELELGLEPGLLKVQGQATGELQSQPWQLELKPTVARFDGQLQTEGISVEVAGQSVRVRGSFARGGGALDFEADPLDLAKLAPLLGAPEPMSGNLSLTGRLEGGPQAPQLTLSLRGRAVALGQRPPLDFQLEARLDSARGLLDSELAVAASSPPPGPAPLELKLTLAHRFRGGRGWQSTLPDGTFDATLTLARLDSRFAQAWAKLDKLPAEGSVTAFVHAEGTRQDPKLTARVGSQATVFGSALVLETELDYADGAASLALAVDDARGPWTTLSAALDLERGRTLSVTELAARLPSALRDEAWRVGLELHERRLDELPSPGGRVQAPVSASATLDVSHAPGAEPQATLRAMARPSHALQAYRGRDCRGTETRVELVSELRDGQLKGVLTGRDGPRVLLDAHVEAPLALRPALSGKPPELGPLKGELRADALSLPTLPLLCGVARGTVTAHATFDDPLGKSPQLKAEVRARGFSLGSPDTLDADLDASLSSTSAQADLKLMAEGGSSSLHAELPIELKAGRLSVAKNAALQADLVLRRLPISPLLDPKGVISYASGTLDGSARARGTLDAPELQGELKLNDLAFTATDLAQPLREVSGTLRFSRNQLQIRGFQAHDKDGSLRVDGDVTFEPKKRVSVKLDVAAKSFPLRQQGQVVATADIAAKVRTEVAPARTDVDIQLGAVDVWIESLDVRTGVALEPHPDFSIDGVRAVEAATEPAAKLSSDAAVSHVTQLKLSARDRVWVKRDDFAVKLSANLTTHIEGKAALVKGGVKLERGYLQLMGKTFDIEKGSHLDFVGSPAPDPVLDITAVHDNRRSGQVIKVQIKGRSSAPILTFLVDDRVETAGGAFQAIYGSQQSSSNPSSADNEAKAFVGGLTAGLLATTARRELGAAAPIVMIEPGQESGEGRIRAGFEFDSLVPKFLRNVVTGVYFEGIVANESSGQAGSQQSDASVQTGFLLELYFPRSFFTAGQYGPGSTWSIDVGWQL